MAGPDGLEIAGHPRLRLRVVSDAPVATLAARLCDVFPDGTSALVTRGTLNLTRREGLDRAEPLEPGVAYDVEVELEATAWRWRPGQRVRLALAGSDWPNAVAPPAPVTLEVLGGELVLPVLDAESPYPPTELKPGGPAPEGESDGVTWRYEHDVLRRTTSAVIDHGGEYPTAYGRFREHYSGRVEVDRRTFAQRATARVDVRARHVGRADRRRVGPGSTGRRGGVHGDDRPVRQRERPADAAPVLDPGLPARPGLSPR